MIEINSTIYEIPTWPGMVEIVSFSDINGQRYEARDFVPKFNANAIIPKLEKSLINDLKYDGIIDGNGNPTGREYGKNEDRPSIQKAIDHYYSSVTGLGPIKGYYNKGNE